LPELEFDEFTIALLVSGQTPNSDAFQDAHLAHLASLHDAGSLLAAGRSATRRASCAG
jgi:uncharacterized protein YciI